MDEYLEKADNVENATRRRLLAVAVVVLLVAASMGFFTIYAIYILDRSHLEKPDLSTIHSLHEMAGIDRLHGMGITGKGVVIGLVDTGMDVSHPSLEHVTIVAWKDLIQNREHPYDDGSHGTQMAGVIFSKGELTGAAPDADLILVKAVREDGTSDDSIIARAIRFCLNPDDDWSTDDGADIISLSLGSKARKGVIGTQSEAAVREAIDRGVIVVAAAGNDGQNDDGQVDSPSTVEWAISVGAVDANGVIAPFSSIGNNGEDSNNPFSKRYDPNKKPETVMPGVRVPTTYPGGKYVYSYGTSPATAMAAGLLALVIQNSTLEDSEGVSLLKECIMETSSPLELQNVPHDRYYGYGILQGVELRTLWHE